MATFISGLGSSSVVHGAEAMKAWKAAGSRLMAANKLIDEGRCLDAHAQLWPAHKAIGLAQAHSVSVSGDMRDQVLRIRSHVEDMDRETGRHFRARCILK